MAINPNRYQYQFDSEGLAGPPDFNWRENIYDEEGSPLGLHFSNLFDQNEDGSGEVYDLATGEKIDNATETSIDGLRIIELADDAMLSQESEDILGPIID
jgi:hypothetical protein